MDDEDRKTDGPRKPGRNAGGPRGKGPRAAGKPGGFSKGGGRAKPAARTSSAGADGPRPFRGKPRAGTPESRSAGEERDRRPFRKPSGSGGDKPFFRKDASGERRSGAAQDFRPRERAAGEGAEKPFRSASRPGDRGGERPPRRFEKEGAPRPGRKERETGRAEGEFKPRSFGTKRHASAEAPSSDKKPRSYGMKEHRPPRRDEGPRQERRADRPIGAAIETGERIAKRLARAGIASRREAEDLVAAGRVSVNGKVLQSAAFNVAETDRIEVDGTEIPAIERTRLFLFHKPTGVVTTNRDPEGRRTVFDILPKELPRLMTVGRLDINTEGLLLLTNDGGLARVLELPATGWLRRYRVRVHGQVEEAALTALKQGIAVGGVFYGAIEASLERVQGTNAWLSIGLREGKNREVKNVLGALGLEVTRLIRVSFGPFQLGELAEGAVQELKGRTLRDQLGERLIEEAGANFEAPVTTPFSNRPVHARHTEEHPVRRVRRPDPLVQEPGEGGLIKSRKRQREERRESALDRLSTRPPSTGRDAMRRPEASGKGGSGGGTRPPRDARPAEPAAPRRANVWMAPGARPQGKPGKPAGKGPPRGGRGRPSGGRKG